MQKNVRMKSQMFFTSNLARKLSWVLTISIVIIYGAFFYIQHAKVIELSKANFYISSGFMLLIYLLILEICRSFIDKPVDSTCFLTLTDNTLYVNQKAKKFKVHENKEIDYNNIENLVFINRGNALIIEGLFSKKEKFADEGNFERSKYMLFLEYGKEKDILDFLKSNNVKVKEIYSY